MKLDGAVVALTGAGSDLGRHLAVELGRRGATVALADHREECLAATSSLLTGSGNRASSSVVDLGNRNEAQAWAAFVIAEHGRVDALINNVGTPTAAGRPDEVPYDDLRRGVNLNLWGPIHATLSYLPHLRGRPQASIVTIAGTSSLVGFRDQGGYCGALFGVRGFMEGLALELARSRIRVLLAFSGRLQTPTVMSAARKIVAAAEHDRTRVLIGWDATVVAQLARILPGSYSRVAGLDRFQPAHT